MNFFMRYIKLLALTLMLLTFGFSNAQEQVGKIDIEQIGTFSKTNHSISSTNSNNIVTLLTYDGKMKAYHFDEQFNSLEYPLSRKLDNGGLNNLVGHKIIGNAYSFIYSDNVRNALAIFTFQFDERTTLKNRIDLDYSGERIVEAFSSYNDRFFIFFASTDGELILRELSDDYTSLVELARYSITDKEIAGETIKFKRQFLYSKANYVLMGDNVPSPMAKSFSKYKLFNEDNKLILTVENGDIGTSVYVIDLQSLKLKERFFEYPKGKVDKFQEFNSYISNKTLFVIGVSNKEMTLQIKNLFNEFNKEFYVTKDEEITFKNSIIKQKGGTMIPFQGKREFDDTAKYLRKISSEIVGINVHYNQGAYEVNIGGLKDNIAMGMLMVASGSYGVDTDQITQITCLFDENFEHVNSEVEMSSFDMINEFEDNLKRDTNSNVFYSNGELLYSYINKKEKELRFLKF